MAKLSVQSVSLRNPRNLQMHGKEIDNANYYIIVKLNCNYYCQCSHFLFLNNICSEVWIVTSFRISL